MNHRINLSAVGAAFGCIKSYGFVLGLLIAVMSNSAQAQDNEFPLYNVTFNAPEHVLGKAPAFGDGFFPMTRPSLAYGASRMRVTTLGWWDDPSLEIGLPTDIPSVSSMAESGLQFSIPDAGENHASDLLIEMDFLVEESNEGSMTLSDSSRTFEVTITPDPNLITGDQGHQIYSDSWYRLGVQLRYSLETWIVTLNGKEIFSSPGLYRPQTQPDINLVFAPSESFRARVDEIRISELCGDPRMEVYAPAAGEGIEAGSTYTVRWNASTGIYALGVEYSIDDGKTWNEINRWSRWSLPSCEWKVPANLACDTCQLRIVDLETGQIAQSESTFRVYRPQSPPQFRMLDLSKRLKGIESYYLSMNDLGWVTGMVNDGRPDYGFLLADGQVTRFEFIPIDINNYGEILFNDMDGDQDRIKIWKDGIISEVPVPNQDWMYQELLAMNNLGDILGIQYNYGDIPFVLMESQIQPLGPLPIPYQELEDLTLSDAGSVAGTMSFYNPSTYEYRERAFVWNEGVYHILDGPSGGSSESNAINISGTVAGSYFRYSDFYGDYTTACVWNDGRCVSLGFPEFEKYSSSSEALDLNDLGHAVIQKLDFTDGSLSYYLWKGKSIIDLGPYLGPDYVADMFMYAEINNRDQILLSGGWMGVVLLTPASRVHLDGLEIIGPDKLREGSTTAYRVIADYDWADPQTVTETATLEVVNGPAQISAEGLLTADAVGGPSPVTFKATYSEGGITRTAEKTLTVYPNSPMELRVPQEYATIQAAVDAAKDSDVVLVADGIYTGDGNRTIDFSGKQITVRSENGPENCILDLEDNRGFYLHSFENQDAVIEGLTMINGWGDDGGAIYLDGASPRIINCIFRDNQAGRLNLMTGDVFGGNGGAIYLTQGNPQIEGCRFYDQLALETGGAICGNSCTLQVRDCLFQGNRAYLDESITTTGVDRTVIGGTGGAISVWKGRLEVRNSNFDDNGSIRSGGALYSHRCDIVIDDSVFRNNWLDCENYPGWSSEELNGGGLSIFNGNIAIRRCRFDGNRAFGGGGGISAESCTGVIDDCVFTGNRAEVDRNINITGVNRRIIEGAGGALLGSQSDLVIDRCRFTGNSALLDGGAIQLGLSTAVISNSQLSGNRADGYTGEPPYPSWNGAGTGGAIGFYMSQWSSIRCTFDGNRAERGDTMGETGTFNPYILTQNPPENQFLVSNCIIQDEDETSFYLTESTGTVYNSDLQGDSVDWGNWDWDPMFVRPGRWEDAGTPQDQRDDVWIDGDYRLRWESPCIDRGSWMGDQDWTLRDLEGKPRLLLRGTDLGAIETPLPGDTDWDNDADLIDLLVMAGQWLIHRSDPAEPYLTTDLDWDGTVNVSDLAILSQFWMYPWD